MLSICDYCTLLGQTEHFFVGLLALGERRVVCVRASLYTEALSVHTFNSNPWPHPWTLLSFMLQVGS